MKKLIVLLVFAISLVSTELKAELLGGDEGVEKSNTYNYQVFCSENNEELNKSISQFRNIVEVSSPSVSNALMGYSNAAPFSRSSTTALKTISTVCVTVKLKN